MTLFKESVIDQTRISEKTPQWVLVLHEVEQLHSQQEKSALLTHQLNAIMKEHFSLPFHSYAMVGQGGFAELHDGLYLSSNVLDRCQNAIDAARDAAHRTRYIREKKQVESLIALLQSDVAEFTLPALTLLAAENASEKKLPQGWSTARGLLSPEVCWQLKIKSDTEHIVGKKYFSIMPQSSVHEGWKSMYLICQPAYLPEYDMWIVLQDQHMLEASWQQHHSHISQLNPKYVPFSDDVPLDDHEFRIMTQCIELSTEYQLLPAQEAFIHLLYADNSGVLAQQRAILAHFNHISESFPTHIQYLLDTLELDQKMSSEHAWSQQKSERIFQAMEKTMHTLLLNKSVTDENTATWLQEYQEIFSTKQARSNPWLVRSSHQLLSLKSAQWLSEPVISKLECFTGSFGLMSKFGGDYKNLTAAIRSHSLTRFQLEKLVGSDRIKYWKKGICRVCHTKDFVGECRVCKNCEDVLTHESTDPNLSLEGIPILEQKNRENKEENFLSVTVAQFITGDIPAYST